MEYRGIVVDDNDPQKQSRVRVRIFGYNKPDDPIDSLPWIVCRIQSGGSGSGHSVTYRKGDCVRVSPLNDSGTDWEVIGADTVHREKKTTPDKKSPDNAQEKDYGADVVNEKANSSPVPDIFTGDIEKLANTVFNILKSNLFNFTKSANPSNVDPNQIVTQDIDYTTNPENDVPRDGKTFSGINTYIKRGESPIILDSVIIELNEDQANQINGYDEDGSILHPYLNGVDFIVPRLVDVGEYTIEYTVTDKNDNTNTSTSSIKFRVNY